MHTLIFLVILTAGCASRDYRGEAERSMDPRSVLNRTWQWEATIVGRKDGILRLGLSGSRSWDDTLGSGLDDQYAAEIYCQCQVSRFLTITPEILLVDGNPLDDVSILGDNGKNISLIMKDGKIYKNTIN